MVAYCPCDLAILVYLILSWKMSLLTWHGQVELIIIWLYGLAGFNLKANLVNNCGFS